MRDKVFVDTNIWVYAHLEAENDSKYLIANKLVEESVQSFTVSTQVLHEYYSAMLKNKRQMVGFKQILKQ